jgi:hypothetical protein
MQPGHEKLRTAGEIMKTIGSAIVHQLISTVGVILLSGQLVFLFCSIARNWSPYFTPKLASRILTQIPGFPIQAAVGLSLGFIFGKFAQRKVMVWMWVLPLVLFVATALYPPLGGSLFGPYSAPDAGKQISLLDRLSYSLPFIASAAYALGAKLTRRRGGGWRTLVLLSPV